MERIMEHYYNDEDKYEPLGHSKHSCPPAAHLTDGPLHGLLAVPHRVRQQVIHAESEIQRCIMLSERRASGFYQLWEAALHKESKEYTFAASAAAGSTQATTAPGTMGPTGGGTTSFTATPVQAGDGEPSRRSRRPTKKSKAAVEAIPKRLSNGELARMFTEFSARELSRVQQAPETKWTWGTDLTEADLRGIVRAADNDFQIPHSDYDISLPMGRIGGVESTGQDLDSETSMPHTAMSQSVVPELSSDDVPSHFTRYPLRRQRSGVPDGFPPINMNPPSPPDLRGVLKQTQDSTQPPINDSDLLDLALAALNP